MARSIKEAFEDAAMEWMMSLPVVHLEEVEVTHDTSKCTGCEWCDPEIAAEQARIEAELDQLEEDALENKVGELLCGM